MDSKMRSKSYYSYKLENEVVGGGGGKDDFKKMLWSSQSKGFKATNKMNDLLSHT